MDSSPKSSMSRTCPWCASTSVVAFSEEGLIRALVRHLEACRGDGSNVQAP
jgi:hypothetical protein